MFPRMAKKTKRPTFTHCKVTTTANPRAPWRVWYEAEKDGHPARVFRSFASEDAAYAFAEDKETEISNHGRRFGDVPAELRRAFDFYRDERMKLEAEGVEVPRIETIISEAMAEIRRKHSQRMENAITVAEAVALFLEYKGSRVGARQVIDLRTRLTRFAEEHGTKPMQEITTREIELWLSSMRSRKNPDKKKLPPLLGSLARNHYRATLHAFFKYGTANARGWTERNPVADLEPERVEMGEPKAYTPEDAAKLMQIALDQMPEVLPVLTLGMFAGLRVSEALECELGKLPREAGEFRVTGKTGPRMAMLTETAAAWLYAQPRRKGKVWTKGPRMFVDAMQELFKLAKVQPIDNGARHSFITYRTAELRDVARVADECGNSVSTIKNHYRQLVTSEDAIKFFAITPEDKKAKKRKIIHFKTV